MSQNSEKYEFNTDFQWDIIKFTLTEPRGYKALEFYKSSYFDLIDQQVIVKAVEQYYKKRSRIPGTSAVLIEQLKSVFKSRDFAQLLKATDREAIRKKVRTLYKAGVKDSEEILDSIVNFASYIQVKDVISNFDISNYDTYAIVAAKLQNAVNQKRKLDTKTGSFLVSGIRGRILRRKFNDSVLPTPFKQLNNTTNAHGYAPGSLLVILDKQKGGKTLSLINIAREYVSKMQKKVVYLDFENGQLAIEDRIDQSVMRVSKLDIVNSTDEMDQAIKKMYRKYKRLGGELYVERLSAGSTFNDVDQVFERLKEDYGFIPNVLVADYLVLMSPIVNQGANHEDVSQVYIDAKNFAAKWGLDCVWTANHINRQAHVRRHTRYESTDAAKALDIGRHADAILGINQTTYEMENNIMRWEIVDQRDGRTGPIFFMVNHETQHIKEFSQHMIVEYKQHIAGDSNEYTSNSSHKDQLSD